MAYCDEEEEINVDSHLVCLAMHTDTPFATTEFEKYVQDDNSYMKVYMAAHELMN